MNFFYCRDGSEVEGPITRSELDRLVQSGKLQANTLVCAEGSETWEAYHTACGRSKVNAPPNTYLVLENGVSKGRFARAQIRSMWKNGALTADATLFDSAGDRWIPVAEVVDSFAFADFLSKAGLDSNEKDIKPLMTATESKIADAQTSNKGCAMIAAPLAVLLILIGSWGFHTSRTEHTITEVVGTKVDIRPWAEPKNKPSLVEWIYNPEQAAERYNREKRAAMFPLREITETRPKNSGDYLFEFVLSLALVLAGIGLFSFACKCAKASRPDKTSTPKAP